jgi:nitroreductase
MSVLPANMNVMEIIKTRKSWRTYDGKAIEDEKKDRIHDFISALGEPPFGSEARFRIIDINLKGAGTVSGTYGVVKGAKSFLAGAITKSPMDLEDFGYLFEKIILFATGMGLATCWMGATFSRPLFSEKMGLKPEEIIPAISPVGYGSAKRSLRDAVFHLSAGSRNRKKWPELFFDGSFQTPLRKGNHEKLDTLFEMVRLAPSAVNKQPWRLILDGMAIHFFLNRTKGFEKMFKMDLQRIDMGIAICHFELAAGEVGINGAWKISCPEIQSRPEDIDYVVSWECSGEFL